MQDPYGFERKENLYFANFIWKGLELFVYDEFHNFTTVNCVSLFVYLETLMIFRL